VASINVVVDGEDTGWSRVVIATAAAAEESNVRFTAAIDKAADRAGNIEGPAMGAADLLDGIGGVFGVNTSTASGYLRSIGDLAGGFSTIAPLIGVISPVWAAIGAFAAANPIGIAIIGVVAVGAALVLAYQHFGAFRNLVDGGLRVAASGFGALTAGAAAVLAAAAGAWRFVVGLFDVGAVWRGVTGGVGALADLAAGAFRWATSFPKLMWNAVAGWWNRNLAGRRFGYTMPAIPVLHDGGTVTAHGILPLRPRTVRVDLEGGAGILTMRTAERILADIVRLDRANPTSDLVLAYT
jgi:hypothetical protein